MSLDQDSECNTVTIHRQVQILEQGDIIQDLPQTTPGDINLPEQADQGRMIFGELVRFMHGAVIMSFGGVSRTGKTGVHNPSWYGGLLTGRTRVAFIRVSKSFSSTLTTLANIVNGA